MPLLALAETSTGRDVAMGWQPRSANYLPIDRLPWRMRQALHNDPREGFAMMLDTIDAPVNLWTPQAVLPYLTEAFRTDRALGGRIGPARLKAARGRPHEGESRRQGRGTAQAQDGERPGARGSCDRGDRVHSGRSSPCGA